MKFAIMGAMLKEVEKIKSELKETKETIIAGRTYYEGLLAEHKIILVFSRWGKVAAASTATTLIDKFEPDYLIFTGVAGGVDPKLNIGDIVISEGLYQHDMDARPFFEKHQIPLTDTTVIRPIQDDLNKAKKAVSTAINQLQNNSPELLDKFSITSPQFHTGTIATGDKFVGDAATNPDLQLPGEDVLATEMEGAAVAQVCSEHNIPFMIFRTISDNANHSAHIDFEAFVTEVASEYSMHIIENFISQFS